MTATFHDELNQLTRRLNAEMNRQTPETLYPVYANNVRIGSVKATSREQAYQTALKTFPDHTFVRLGFVGGE